MIAPFDTGAVLSYDVSEREGYYGAVARDIAGR